MNEHSNQQNDLNSEIVIECIDFFFYVYPQPNSQ
jgi:hypothetical protein